MKTKTIIVFYLILFIIGLAMAGFPQGIVNDGGYIKGTSSNYIKFSGSGNAYLIGTTADQTVLGHLNVDFTGAGTYDLTITDSSYVTVDGNLTLSDSLRLQADNNSMASLITNGTVSGSYSIVEQYLKPDQWHMVSSPVASAQASVYSGSYLMKWNEPDSTWSFITSLTDPLVTTTGYFAWSESSISSPTDVEYTGLINTGNKTVLNLSYNAGSDKGDGWNLVGNSYPSALEWTSSWTKSNIDATIYVYDGTQYLTWNYNLGGFGTKTDGSIPSTQGFWIKANASSPSMTLLNSERIHSSQSFYKGSDATLENIFSIEVEGNKQFTDKLILGMYPNATDLFDSEYDAYKLFGSNEAPQLYTITGSEQLSVNLFEPVGDEKKVVDLGFKTGVEGKYILDFQGLENVDKMYSIYLEDKISILPYLKLIDVRKNPEYKFNSAPGMKEHRFTLHFQKSDDNKENVMQGIENQFRLDIYAYQKNVFINYTMETKGEAVIYDLMGREILRSELDINSLNKIPVNAGQGYYIVKVFSATSVKSQKVFIN